jgi:hypothetical protein
MPHITETTVAAAVEAGTLAEGARLCLRVWNDDQAPHAALEAYITADSVKGHADGGATVTYTWYREGSRTPRLGSVDWAGDRVVALVAMKPLGVSDSMTYAHHDDRLTLDGGHLNAHPGTMHRLWDAYRADGERLAEGVSIAEGRALLS